VSFELGGHHPIDAAVRLAFPELVVGVGVTPLLLFVPSGWSRFAVFIVHLAAVVVLGLVAAWRLRPLVYAEWYPTMPWSGVVRRLAGGASLVVIVTGVVGLVTLATAAALRLQPSLQFLSLLSALDIAWAGAAIVFGAQRRWGRRAAFIGGTLLGVFCVASIWNYLRVVGFDPEGGWELVGSELMRLVLPGDMLAAVVAVAVFWAGMGPEGASYPIEQASDQS
jgi:hypothetical protein